MRVFGWLDSWLFDGLVWLDGDLVVKLVGGWADLLVGCLVGQLVGRWVSFWVDRWVGWLVAQWVDWWFVRWWVSDSCVGGSDDVQWVGWSVAGWARQGTDGNSRHSDRNIRGTCTTVCHHQKQGGPV